MYKVRSYSVNKIKAIFIIIVLLATIFQSNSSVAQSVYRAKKHSYAGFDVAFGTRSFSITSDIQEINKMKVLEEGGSLGVFFGNDIAQFKLRHGFFYSASRVKQTVDLRESELNVNVNILNGRKTRMNRFQPYVLAGIERSSLKFFGFYDTQKLNPDELIVKVAQNHSVSEAPYVGKIVALRANVGLGFQYRIPVRYSYVKIYSEGKMGHVFSTSSKEFAGTSVSKQLSISVGINFGL